MRAGRLRHRIRIEQRSEVRDADGDLLRIEWPTFADDVPAEIAPLSAREMRLAGSQQSEVTARITIRWLAGLKGSMRAVDLVEGTVYGIGAPINDNASGREWITLNATEGVNDG